MERERTELPSTGLSATPSRRALLRSAAALIGAAGLAGIAAETRAASRGRAARTRAGVHLGTRKAGRTGKHGTCRTGTGTGRIELPANGDPVKTPVLARGRTYRVRASGFVGLENADGSPALGLPAVDADYGFFRQGAPRPNDRVGILDWVAIDGKVPAWGAFAEDHEYAIVVAGRGKPLSLHLVYDAGGFAPNGQGKLLVEIACA